MKRSGPSPGAGSGAPAASLGGRRRTRSSAGWRGRESGLQGHVTAGRRGLPVPARGSWWRVGWSSVSAMGTWSYGASILRCSRSRMMTVSLPSSCPSSRTSVPNQPLRPVPFLPVPSSPAGSGSSYMRNHLLPSRRSEPGTDGAGQLDPPLRKLGAVFPPVVEDFRGFDEENIAVPLVMRVRTVLAPVEVRPPERLALPTVVAHSRGQHGDGLPVVLGQAASPAQRTPSGPVRPCQAQHQLPAGRRRGRRRRPCPRRRPRRRLTRRRPA